MTATALPTVTVAMPTADAIRVAADMAEYGLFARLDYVGGGMTTVTALSNREVQSVLDEAVANEG